MATYYVYSGAAGANNGSSWTDAYTTFASAVTAATTSGDIILVHKTHQGTLAATTIWTLAAGVHVYVVDKDASDALAIMGTGGWIGGTGNFAVTLNGAGYHHVYGLTIRNGGTSNRDVTIGDSDEAHWEMEDCFYWTDNTSTGVSVIFGHDNADTLVRLVRPTFRFGAAQRIEVRARLEIYGGSISSAGSVPAYVFSQQFVANDTRKMSVYVEGFDASYAGSAPLFNEAGEAATGAAYFVRCKLGSGYAMLNTARTMGNGIDVFVFDSATDDTHTVLGHQNALGSTVIDTSIYVTADSEALSWKVASSANANFYKPYRSPWIDRYNADVATSIQPYIEILRDGSTTAYQDDEVWAEFTAKQTSGFPISTLLTGRMTHFGAPSNHSAGTGTGNWTGESGSAWSGKLQAPSSFTPAEIGHIRGRICIGEPSTTVYASPRVRV